MRRLGFVLVLAPCGGEQATKANLTYRDAFGSRLGSFVSQR